MSGKEKEPKLKHLRNGDQALILNPVEADPSSSKNDKVYATHVAACIGTMEKIEPNSVSDMVPSDSIELTD